MPLTELVDYSGWLGYKRANLYINNTEIITGNAIISGVGNITTIYENGIVYISGSASQGAGEINTASNLGVGFGLFSDKNNIDLRFNSITGGSGIGISQSGNTYLVNNTSPYCILLATPVTLTNMAAALGFYAANVGYQTPIDLSRFTGVKVNIVKGATAGDTHSIIRLHYNSTFSTTAANYSPIDSNSTRYRINTTNAFITSGWLPIVDAAKTTVFLALQMSGGGGTADPQVGIISAEFM